MLWGIWKDRGRSKNEMHQVPPSRLSAQPLTCKSNEIIDSITSKRTCVSTLFSSFLELTNQCSGASSTPGLLLSCLLLLFFPLFCLNVLLSWRSSSLKIFAPINTTRIVQLTPYLHISTMLADLHICYMYTYIYETLSKT